MDENRVEGAFKNVGGKVQDAVGGLTGDSETQAQGKINQMAGKAQGLYGEAVDDLRDFTTDQPVVALLAAVGLGFIFGTLIARR